MKIFLFCLQKNKTKTTNTETIETDKINPDKITQVLDKRSWIVLTTIPLYLNVHLIIAIIEFYDNINYLHINQLKKNIYKTFYINIVNYKSFVPVYIFLRKAKLE